MPWVGPAAHCVAVPEIESLGALVSRIVGDLEAGLLRSGFEEPIQRGSASGSVSVIDDPEEPGLHLLKVTLRVMKVPSERTEEFYRRLLELNRTFNGRAAFSVNATDVVSLTAARPVADLDSSEVIDLILWTSDKADDLDDKLLTEFGYQYQF